MFTTSGTLPNNVINIYDRLLIDYILSGVWGSITILGLIVQFRTLKGKPVLPIEAPRKKRKRKSRVRRTGASRNRIDIREDRLPVLVNSEHENRVVLSPDTDEEQLPRLIESNSRVRRNNESKPHHTKHGTNVVC